MTTKTFSSNIESLHPLTPLQMGLLFESIKYQEASCYLEQSVLTFTRPVNPEDLGKAFQKLMDRHAILRSAILYEKGDQPMQVFFRHREMDYKVFQGSLAEAREEDLARGMDLKKDCLIRATFLDGDRQQLILTFHHIIMDGWSVPIIVNDLMDLYRELVTGQVAPPASEADFKDYLNWLTTKDQAQSLKYWQGLLADVDEAARFPSLFKEDRSSRLDQLVFTLEPSLFQGIRKLCDKANVTLNTFMETALGSLLAMVTASSRVTLGKVISGRNTEGALEIDRTPGLFINTVPLLVAPEKAGSTKDLLKVQQDQGYQAESNGFCSLAEIGRLAGLEKIFDILLAFENFYIDEGSEEVPLCQITDVREETNYPLVIQIGVGDGLSLRWTWAAGEYAKEDINWYQALLEELCVFMVANPEKSPLKCPFKGTEVIDQYNQENTGLLDPKGLLGRIRDQLAGVDRVVLKDEWGEMTGDDLWQKSLALAQELELATEEPVGLYLDRNRHAVTGILGILLAGGAYVPLDPNNPQSRQDLILGDSQIHKVLHDGGKDISRLKEAGLDTMDLTKLKATGGTPSVRSTNALAYIMYTSGSTGKPKGVMIQDQAILRLIDGLPREVKGGTILQAGSLAFDAATFEIFTPLMTGGQLVFLKDHTAEAIGQAIDRHGIETMWLTAALFNQLVDEAISSFQGLKHLLIGGQALSESHVARFMDRYQDEIQLWNGYGPTEATTFTTLEKIQDAIRPIPIGRPIGNTPVEIRWQGQARPAGMAGELCIYGPGIARGYLHDEELTDQRFIDTEKGRCYRTGDKAMYLPDGRLIFLGRFDSQVKLRGFRIELEEIEFAIKTRPEIRDACVVLRPTPSGDELVAFYVGSVTDQDLRGHLSQKLPAYMVPTRFQALEQLPVTINGKVDRRALREMPLIESLVQEDLTELEELIYQAFSRVLNRSDITKHDDFFSLGGHSLRAIMLINELARSLGKRLTIRQVFENPTIKALAALFDDGSKEAVASQGLVKVANQADWPLSPAQQRMLIVQTMAPDSVQYNIPMMLPFKDKLDPARLKKAIEQVLSRHDMLRTSFSINGEATRQVTHERVDLPWQVGQTSKADIEEAFLNFVKPFDLSEAPLMRAALWEYESGSCLFLDVHHLIADGTSITILLEEIMAAYHGRDLPVVTLDYHDYVAWLEKQDLNEMKDFWLKEFASLPEFLNFPLDKQRPAIMSEEGFAVNFAWPADMMARVKELARANKTTEFVVILTLFKAILAKYTDQRDIVVGTTLSGRLHAEAHDMVGMFINTIPLRSTLGDELTLTDLIQAEDRRVMAAFDHQAYPFEQLLDDLKVPRDYSRSPLFEVLFTLQNTRSVELSDSFDEELEPIQLPLTKYDLTLTAQSEEDACRFTLDCRADIFRPETMAAFTDNFTALARYALHHLTTPFSKWKLLPEDQRATLLNDWQGDSITIQEESIGQRLFRVCSPLGQKTLIESEDGCVSADRFLADVAAMAKKLRDLGMAEGDYVALHLTNRYGWLVGIFGTICAGGAFLTLNPEDPMNRKEGILSETRPFALIQEGVEEAIAFDLVLSWQQEEGELGADPYPDPQTTAYVLYTSGSTGRPKGVPINHKAVINLVEYFKETFDWGWQETMLQFANPVFDASVWEVMTSLLNGMKLRILSEDQRLDPGQLEEVIMGRENTVALLPPVVAAGLSPACLKKMAAILTGGSAPSADWVRGLPESVTYLNAYGPTEATVLVTLWQRDRRQDGIIPMGKPIANVRLYVMQSDELCGVGMPGELVIGGLPLTEAYLHRPELNRTAFSEDPFMPGRVFRSGDRVRWLPGGELEFLGRLDQQVKLRGYRIELGEIESSLLKVPNVTAAVARLRKDPQGDYLAAWVTGRAQETELLAALQEDLPAYMIPSRLAVIDEIPLNASGKVDDAALPDFELADAFLREPETEKEKLLCQAFEEVLGLAAGRESDFFRLGGDSIKAIRLVSLLRDSGYGVEVKDILRLRTVARIAAALTENTAKEYPQGPLEGLVPFSPLMKAMLTDWQFEKPAHFNLSNLFKLDGLLSSRKLKEIMGRLTDHHDLLRAVVTPEGLLIQAPGADNLYRERVVEVSDLAGMEAAADAMQASLDLQGPLMGLLQIAYDGEVYLLWVIHHLICDGVSWRILTEDFNRVMAGKALPSKTCDYRSWQAAMKLQAKQEADFWSGLKPIKNPFPVEGKAEKFEMSLDPEATEKLLKDCHEAYGTRIDDVLLTALVQAAGQPFTIALESHGRDCPEDVSRTVGWFTAVYPLPLFPHQNPCDSLIEIKETLRAIPRSGSGYGWQENKVARPVLSYNYLGQIDSQSGQDLPMGQAIAGENRLPWKMGFNASVVDGRFNLLLEGPKAKELGQAFQAELMNLLEELTSQDEVVQTKSDIDIVDTDDEDLAELHALLGLE